MDESAGLVMLIGMASLSLISAWLLKRWSDRRHRDLPPSTARVRLGHRPAIGVSILWSLVSRTKRPPTVTVSRHTAIG